jgi:hypothetical protein
MKLKTAGYATCPLVSIAAAFLITMTLAEPLRAQQRSGLPERERDLLARETQLRAIEKPIKQRPVHEVRMLLRQINEDFQKIQLVNLEMIKTVSGAEVLDVKKIQKSADEIRTLASRLKSNLILPESEEVEIVPQFGPEREGVKAALFHLSKKVRSFVRNPVFQTSSQVVDAQLSAQARNDLETIIELCRNIKKSAAKLERESGRRL